jgi:alcohol dehydrogenase (cytochrome c)
VRSCILPLLVLLAAGALQAQVPFDRILRAADEPHNWLTYSGTTFSQRHSQLTQITRGNVAQLELQWVHQAMTNEPSVTKFEATPLVVDGVMYTVLPPNDVVALDAAEGRVLWTHRYVPAPTARPCCGRVNRGVAILGDRLFMGTIDGHLLAIDATTGRRVWDVTVGRPEAGYSLTHAPLVVKNMVIVGPAGGEFGIRGFLAAFDAATGRERWRFNTVPGPGEPGHESWGGDSWKTGGAPIWVTGSYDPDSNLTYWGTGNPSPAWNGDTRAGDNLYSNSVVALDADTGALSWHFQFTPHDEFDYDAAQVPVLADIARQGRPRKVLLWANRNGFFYILDRLTGEFLLGKPFVEVTWASGLDAKGRPLVVPEMLPRTGGGAVMAPGNPGATNWWSPSFSPVTGLFYVPTQPARTSRYVKEGVAYVEGEGFLGGGPKQPRSPDEAIGYGAVRAIDPASGAMKWEFKLGAQTQSGVLTTASNVLFTGSREGYFYALDASTGSPLWRFTIGGVSTIMGPITYAVKDRQFVAVASGVSTFAFALRR